MQTRFAWVWAKSFPIFHAMEDPRFPMHQRHSLGSAIVIAISSALAATKGPTAIGALALRKEDLLLKLLSLSNGIPRKDMIRCDL